ncbi:MAG: FAD binding domain-containing protein [Acidobacteriota bacterium]
MLPHFRLGHPRTVEEAVAALAEPGSGAAALAGGSDLLEWMKAGLPAPGFLVCLDRIEALRGIRQEGRSLVIGATTRLAELATDERVRSAAPSLASAADSVGSPQIRNVGTLGGNLLQRPRCWYLRSNFPCLKNGGENCYAITGQNQYHAIFGGGPSSIVHPSDCATALTALGARVRVHGLKGAREIPIDKLYRLPSERLEVEHALEAGELLTEIVLPRRHRRDHSAFLKVRDRAQFDFAVVSVACWLRLDGRLSQQARICLGAVAPVPWRARKAEEYLQKRLIDETSATEAARLALDGAEPLEHNSYKIPLARNLVRRALLELVRA